MRLFSLEDTRIHIPHFTLVGQTQFYWLCQVDRKSGERITWKQILQGITEQCNVKLLVIRFHFLNFLHAGCRDPAVEI
jgi:hypothetical protein